MFPTVHLDIVGHSFKLLPGSHSIASARHHSGPGMVWNGQASDETDSCRAAQRYNYSMILNNYSVI